MKFEPPGFDQDLSCLEVQHQIGLRTGGQANFLVKQAVALRDIGRIEGSRRTRRRGTEGLNKKWDDEGPGDQPNEQERGAALTGAGPSPGRDRPSPARD